MKVAIRKAINQRWFPNKDTAPSGNTDRSVRVSLLLPSIHALLWRKEVLERKAVPTAPLPHFCFRYS